jgi:hypothetical protein
LAATDAELTQEQRRRATAARGRVRDAVVDEQRAGRLPPGLDPDAAARALLSLVLGIGMQCLFDPGDWSAEQVRRSLREAITAIAGPTSPRSAVVPAHP